MSVVKLTSCEVRAANALGIPLDVYAKNKRALELERIEHEKWLQTPAGAAYMAKRRKAYEKKLSKFKLNQEVNQ